ncbi:MAG: GIY-YIG nuclease family protein [Lachnospiraceae bacterium]|nr:GIY-YIG nuclease family protein [Lachnospiraceae bacterium]
MNYNNTKENLFIENSKDIYCITNLINGKQYVGQSKNPTERFKEHLRTNDNLPIHKAISKYGKENFKLNILEYKTIEYNEREKYWIKQLNTLVPNGYNVTEGGEGYPHYKGCNMYNSAINENDLFDIFNELLNPKLTISDIAQKHRVRESVIYSINYGTSYMQDNYTYPIRDKNFVNRYILNLLLTQQYTIDEISDLVCLSKSTVKAINNGSRYRQHNISYPILDNQYVLKEECIRKKIKSLLENEPDISISQIAKMFNTTKFAINAFNQGNSYHNKLWNYPLRKTDARTRFFSEEEKENIVEMLLDPYVSKKDILKKYNLGLRVLNKFNNGDEGYRIDNIKYPIRLFRKNIFVKPKGG